MSMKMTSESISIALSTEKSSNWISSWSQNCWMETKLTTMSKGSSPVVSRLSTKDQRDTRGTQCLVHSNAWLTRYMDVTLQGSLGNRLNEGLDLRR